MSEIEGESAEGELDPQAVYDDPPADDAKELGSNTPLPAIEQEALKYGWRPQNTFTKTPLTWRDAATYMELPSTRVKILSDEIRLRDQRLAATEQMARATADRVREQERANYQARIDAFEAQKRQAAESADVAAYDAAQTQQRALKPPAPMPLPEPELDPYVTGYIAKNAWLQDPSMKEWAGQEIQNNPTVMRMGVQDQIAWAERRARENFPHRFAEAEKPERPKVPGSGKVDGGSLAVPGRVNLSADEMKEAENFVKQGIFKNVQEYAAYSAKLYGGT